MTKDIFQEVKIDLFESYKNKLGTPATLNYKAQEQWHPGFRKCRKRIETLFAQLCEQIMAKRNYAKFSEGLKTRLISKIVAVTVL